jgi:hypothetical protein
MAKQAKTKKVFRSGKRFPFKSKLARTFRRKRALQKSRMNDYTLLIHGKNTQYTFTVPRETQVITFTIPGQPLQMHTAFEIMNILGELSISLYSIDFSDFHNTSFKVGSDYVKVRVFNSGESCPSYPIGFLNDNLWESQKIYKTQSAKVEYQIIDKCNFKITNVEGVDKDITDRFYASLDDQMNGTPDRTSSLKNFVNFMRYKINGFNRLFILACAMGDEGECHMLENTDETLKIALSKYSTKWLSKTL